jgi:hypothetical protein
MSAVMRVQRRADALEHDWNDEAHSKVPVRRFESWAGTERKGRAAQVVGVGLSKVYTIA